MTRASKAAGDPARRIEYLYLDEIEGTPGNPKRHDTAGIEASISRHGFAEVPLRDDRTGRIVAGHGRIAELRRAHGAGEHPPEGVQVDGDRWRVPILTGWRSRSDADAGHYVIASNQLTRAAGWDEDLFKAMAAESIRDAEDVLAAGFGEQGLDDILGSLQAVIGEGHGHEDAGALGASTPVGEFASVEFSGEDDEVPEPPAEPVTRDGEVVDLGPHTLHCGDCMELMCSLPENSVDGCVSDPPYGLSPDGRARTWDDIEELRKQGKGPTGGFMGRAWDAGVPGISFARELLRVLKPGAHAVLFGGQRTIHRLTCAVEDAGFEVRDLIGWLTFSGFPKSLDVLYHSMLEAGVCLSTEPVPHAVLASGWHRVELPEVKERIAVALARIQPGDDPALLMATGTGGVSRVRTVMFLSALAGDTNLSTESLWRTLSDAISGATKTSITSTAISPITESRTWRSAVEASTSESTIHRKETRPNGCMCPVASVVESSPGSPEHWRRIPTRSAHDGVTSRERLESLRGTGTSIKPASEPAILLRKPLEKGLTVAQNVLKWGTGALNIDACRYAFGDVAWPGGQDEWESGDPSAAPTPTQATWGGNMNARVSQCHPRGRFPANIYYCPKPSRGERNEGCEDLPEHEKAQLSGAAKYDDPVSARYRSKPMANVHPTVKPVKLIHWLYKLITPPGGHMVEPFCGSGTALVAARKLEDSLGIRVTASELDPAYCDIIRARYKGATQ